MTDVINASWIYFKSVFLFGLNRKILTYFSFHHHFKLKKTYSRKNYTERQGYCWYIYWCKRTCYVCPCGDLKFEQQTGEINNFSLVWAKWESAFFIYLFILGFSLSTLNFISLTDLTFKTGARLHFRGVQIAKRFLTENCDEGMFWFWLVDVRLVDPTSQKPKQWTQLTLLVSTCLLAHCRSLFSSVVLVRSTVLLWMALCLPGCATVHSFTMNKDNEQHSHCHQHSEIQPISGRICSSIIMCNSTALGTNCYTTLRPVMKVSDTAFSAKSRKYHGAKKEEKGEEIGNLFNQQQTWQEEINNAALLRVSASPLVSEVT